MDGEFHNEISIVEIYHYNSLSEKYEWYYLI